MKNTFGNNVSYTVFGESHGEYIGIVIDGMAPGIKIQREFIEKQLSKRRPKGKISTKRVESDDFKIVSGVFNGYTTGTPICIIIPNADTKSSDYEENRFLPRPSHADYTAHIKYKGFEDYRGGGHFSGRITAAIVAAGAICMLALRERNIKIGTHIKSLQDIEDIDFDNISWDIDALEAKEFPVLDREISRKMTERIEQVASEGDSLGGVLESAVLGLPAGLGEPYFDSMESMIAHGLFSVPAVKGVEFGAGFAITKGLGSTVNDELYMEGDRVKTETNNNGGINGGITNGMPLIVRTAVKPTASIYKEQNTVNLKTGENAKLIIKGRHDPAIIHRAAVVVDSTLAMVICDFLQG